MSNFLFNPNAAVFVPGGGLAARCNNAQLATPTSASPAATAAAAAAANGTAFATETRGSLPQQQQPPANPTAAAVVDEEEQQQQQQQVNVLAEEMKEMTFDSPASKKHEEAAAAAAGEGGGTREVTKEASWLDEAEEDEAIDAAASPAGAPSPQGEATPPSSRRGLSPAAAAGAAAKGGGGGGRRGLGGGGMSAAACWGSSATSSSSSGGKGVFSAASANDKVAASTSSSPPLPAAAAAASSANASTSCSAAAAPPAAAAAASSSSITSKRPPPDGRPHLNVVFIGHVDAGKSTTCGNILYLTGGVDERTIEKYEREAKEKNRESWFLAFVMDINEEERQKGKTVEVGRAFFATPNRRFTLLDAPGHRAFVPNMIEGAAQADVGVLIISARKGEFETGFEKGGQTREHALLAKTLGVNQLVVAVNKMDEPTCEWSQKRFDDIEKKLTPFLKSCGFNPAKDITFIPISGLFGQNLKDHVSRPGTKAYDPKAAWYTIERPTLFEVFDRLSPPDRKDDDPLRVPILDGYRDNGIIALGKVEAGTLVPGMNCILMPNKAKVKVVGVYLEDDEVAYAKPGENVRIKLLGIEDDQLVNGCMLCAADHPCPVVSSFVGRLGIVELLEHRPLITVGYSCVLHAHTAREEIVFNALLEVVDKKTKKKKKNPQFIKSDCMVTVEIQFQNPVCLEEFETVPQLGRFTIRDEGKTIGIGRVLQILKTV